MCYCFVYYYNKVSENCFFYSFSFNQNSGSAFGQGSFFSGLGGKPSEENASKNVFGLGSSIKSDTNSKCTKN